MDYYTGNAIKLNAGSWFAQVGDNIFPLSGVEKFEFSGDFIDNTPKINSEDIVEVIFNDPATIIKWKDGSKTIIKCQPGDKYDKEAGLALAICKKVFGNKGNYNEVFKKWVG